MASFSYIAGISNSNNLIVSNPNAILYRYYNDQEKF